MLLPLVSPGVYSTSYVQLAPAAKVDVQVVPCDDSGLLKDGRVRLVAAAFPLLVMVTVCVG